MALTQAIENGEVVKTTTSTSNTKSNNVYDSEMFINLLVAEMKYQDPLEPTSNTEWISQYATFSQVEEMESMADSLAQMQSENLVGQTVIMKSTSANGDTSYYSGQVSYVERQTDGSYKICVTGSSGEKMFNYSDIDSIVDPEYLEALTLSDTFKAIVNSLPSASSLTIGNKSSVLAARTAYDSMTDYQKKFVSTETYQTLTTLEKKMEELTAQEAAKAEANADDASDADDVAAEENA